VSALASFVVLLFALSSWPGLSSRLSVRPMATGRSLQAHGWTVVGLGDSVTSGYGCYCRDFVRLYADRLAAATGAGVTAVNLGRAGSTSDDLLSDLRSDAATRAAVAGADVLVVTIGANDLQPQMRAWIAGKCAALRCFTAASADLQARIDAVLTASRQLHGGRPMHVLVTTYWNVFLDGAPALTHGRDYVAMSRAATAQAERAQCAAAARAKDRCVDLRPAFHGEGDDLDPTALLQEDGDHPNSEGHAAIAAALADRGWMPPG
jgi:lysophospholipase L1-like esterase